MKVTVQSGDSSNNIVISTYELEADDPRFYDFEVIDGVLYVYLRSLQAEMYGCAPIVVDCFSSGSWDRATKSTGIQGCNLRNTGGRRE